MFFPVHLYYIMIKISGFLQIVQYKNINTLLPLNKS